MYEDSKVLTDSFKILAKKFRFLKCGNDIFLNDNQSHEVLNCGNWSSNSKTKAFKPSLSPDFIKDQSSWLQKHASSLKDSVLPYESWQTFALVSSDNQDNGLRMFCGLFTEQFKKYLYNVLLVDLPTKCKESLKSNIDLENLHQSRIEIEKSNLRWVTFGYHYDWTKKCYDKNVKGSTPLQILRDLQTFFEQALGYKAELDAAIVNYYTCKSKLNPHADNREPNLTAPLFSFSLGYPALFLLGKSDRNDSSYPLPIILRDGDLMIMNGPSRLFYHSMNRVICDKKDCDRKAIKRININFRQVF